MDPTRLQVIDVFAQLDPSVLAELAKVIDERAYADGDRIFSEGDLGDTMFCVAEGMVRIEKQISTQGQATKTLSILTPGECFGEMSVLDSKPRSASALALGITRLFCLSSAAFEGLLARSHQSAFRVLFSLMRAMNERIRRLNTSVVAYDEIGRAIGATGNLPELLDLVLHQLVQAVGAERGVVFLKSEFRGEFEPRSSVGMPPGEIPPERDGGSAGLLPRVLGQKVGWIIGNRATDPRCTGLESRSWESAALLLAPIQVATGVLGVLVLGHSRPGRFDVNHLNLVEGIARQTAQAILNLRHREEQQSRARLGRQFVKF